MNRVYLILIGVAVIVAFVMGHSVATTKAELEFTQFKLQQAEAFKVVLKEEQEKYALKEQTLIDSFKRDRQHYDDRMRQLESKLRSRGDLEAVTSERDRCLKLAVEGEALLRQAESIVEALK